MAEAKEIAARHEAGSWKGPATVKSKKSGKIMSSGRYVMEFKMFLNLPVSSSQ